MIITLCGSARFERWFHAWNEALSLAGHAVFGLGSYPSQHNGEKSWYTDEQKRVLDAVHLNKIAASDAAVILNVYAYMGDSTLRELRAAQDFGKRVYFLESWGQGCGIGPLHYEEVRKAAASFGVPAGYGSPMDTHIHKQVWDDRLLGPGGAARSAIVTRLQETTNWTYAA